MILKIYGKDKTNAFKPVRMRNNSKLAIQEEKNNNEKTEVFFFSNPLFSVSLTFILCPDDAKSVIRTTVCSCILLLRVKMIF